MVVYEGILPVCENDDGLAVVMGHEIAHAIARHGNERMSQQMLIQAGSTAAAYALKEKSESTQALLGTAIGLGANYGVVLPFSRKHELEADRLGLIFMCKKQGLKNRGNRSESLIPDFLELTSVDQKFFVVFSLS